MRFRLLLALLAACGSMIPWIGAQEVTLSIVYNNAPHDPQLICDWGMACVVQGLSRTILFDTGGDGEILLSNMAKMGIAPTQIDIVVLSHIHQDHTGGLGAFLQANPRVTVYAPVDFGPTFGRKVRKTGALYTEIEDFTEIIPNAYSTGQLGKGIREQALVIRTACGLAIVTGCSHPGVGAFARTARERLREPVDLITGGFHLDGASSGVIRRIIGELQSLEVARVGPSHCTGEKARLLFEQAWGKDYLEAGCGAVLSIPPAESPLR